jgi:alpha-L-fucosidase 2
MPDTDRVPDGYTLSWQSPSRDSSGSMPLGNGDIGVNLWVEAGGDLLFLIGATGAWSETARLLKLGRVRVRLDPNPFAAGSPFCQTLDLRSGSVVVDAGAQDARARIRVWVDACYPAIRVEIEAGMAVAARVVFETWRTAPRELTKVERGSAYGMEDSPDPIVSDPDTVVGDAANGIIWYHHNSRSIWGHTLVHQGMGSWRASAEDPLLHRTFGGLIRGVGFARRGASEIGSVTVSRVHRMAVYIHASALTAPEAWRKSMETLADADTRPASAAWESHTEWWRRFWERSWIRVSARGEERAKPATRDYNLQRFVIACAGRGAFPLKFNGSLFTVDAEVDGERVDADYRRWGGPYWFQNTRLMYWPLLAAGDTDMLAPLFAMYHNALPFALARTRAYFGHGGAFFPEVMYFWGAYANDNYGWDRTGKPHGLVQNAYIRHYFSGVLELVALGLDAFAHTGDAAMLQQTLLPLADAALEFYEAHYPRDPAGKLRVAPSQALETWQEAVNPMPPVAGLRRVCEGLLALPSSLTGAASRQRWEALLQSLPDLPTRGTGDMRVLAAADIFGEETNSENPELYAVFPYRLFGVLKSELAMARRTWRSRRHKGDSGWRQDSIQAAFLGMGREAANGLLTRLADKNPHARFPVFWGPNYDWVPDQDHGGTALMTLQSMLLQHDGRKILLFPAWPRDWDVEFRLHAPYATTLQGVYRSGRLESLTVDPPERMADAVRLQPQ